MDALLRKFSPLVYCFAAVFFFLFLSVDVAHARSRVTKVLNNPTRVILTQHKKRAPWAKNDQFCVFSKQKEKTGCGRIIKIGKRKALGMILVETGVIERGHRARRVRKKIAAPSGVENVEGGPDLLARGSLAKEEVIANSPATGNRPVKKFKENAITGGASLGFNHFLPFLHYQRAILYNFAIGIEPIYLNAAANEDSFTALGGFLTANYYSFQPFRGLWLQGKLGPLFATATSGNLEESSTIMIIQANVGWREHWVFGSNIAIAAGIQYVSKSDITVLDLKYRGIEFAIEAEIGFTF